MYVWASYAQELCICCHGTKRVICAYRLGQPSGQQSIRRIEECWVQVLDRTKYKIVCLNTVAPQQKMLIFWEIFLAINGNPFKITQQILEDYLKLTQTINYLLWGEIKRDRERNLQSKMFSYLLEGSTTSAASCNNRKKSMTSLCLKPTFTKPPV